MENDRLGIESVLPSYITKDMVMVGDSSDEYIGTCPKCGEDCECHAYVVNGTKFPFYYDSIHTDYWFGIHTEWSEIHRCHKCGTYSSFDTRGQMY